MGSTLVTLVAYGAIEVAMAIAGVARPLCAALELELELVVAAVPVGPLAHAIDAYRQAVAVRVGKNAAHHLLPHCVLVQSYLRDPSALELHQRALAATVTSLRRPPTGPAAIVAELTTDKKLHALEIESPSLLALVVGFAQRVAMATRGDDLMREDPLRLVLAADFDAGDHEALSELAHRIVDPTLPVEWEVGLWQSCDGAWERVWQAPAG